METLPPDFAEKAKETIRSLLPDASAFSEFMKSFFVPPIQKDLDKYVKILTKVGIKNGIDGIAKMYCGITDAYLEDSDKMISAIITDMGKRFSDKSITTNPQEFNRIMVNLSTFEGSMPYAKKIFETGHAYTQKNFSEIDKKARGLPEEERRVYDSFSLLIVKLFAYYIITSPSPIKAAAKELMTKYYKGMNALYAKEKVPNELIKYIESIEIPNEEELKDSLPITAEEQNPPIIVDNFDTPIKAYSPKELYRLYNISDKTFKSWIEPHSGKIGKLKGKRYTPQQVKIIFHLIGEPKT